MKKYILLLLTVFLLSCSTKKNTSLSRGYQKMTTKYNVFFNGKESYKAGIRKVINGHKRSYSDLLPIYLSQDENARAAAFSDMDRASVKCMKAIKLHSITVKPKRKNKTSKEYVKFRKKTEYNDLIDDCYLLKAKADYYNKKYQLADKSFKFIIKQFPTEEIVYEARIWFIRSLVEQNKFTQVKEHLRSLNKKNVPEKYRSDIFLVSAYYYISINDDRAAIENIQRAIYLVDKKEKAYYSYLLAQMYQKVGENSLAMDLFSKIEKMSVSYEMGFNAKISRAISFSGGGNEALLNELSKLLGEKKNRAYKDQIYYAIANVSMKSGAEEKAVDYYWKSTNVSVDNDIQRAISFKALADFYYKNLYYEESFLCYDSCFFYNSSLLDKFKTTKTRYDNLSSLIDKIDVVNKQDSLLNIARMPESERNKIIDEKIQKLKDDRTFLMEQKNKADLDRSFYNQSQISNSNTGITQTASTSGAWYFYNVSLMASGKSEFVRKWGRRRREDNWNRKNKAIVELVDVEDVEEGSEGENIESEKAGDPMTRESYLIGIPMTEEAQQVADSLILESLFSIGEMYADVLNDDRSALRTYENMIERYPDNKYLLYVYFSSYNCAVELRDFSSEEKFKQLVLTKFPKSEYAKLVRSPSYINEMRANLSREDDLYQKAFDMYDKGDYMTCSVICNKALVDYPHTALRDRFLLLKIYSVGKTMSSADLTVEIDRLLVENPNSDLSSILKGIKLNLEAGGIVDQTVLDKTVVKKTKSKKRYAYDTDARHYFVLTFPRTGKNLNMLNYRLNVLCGESLEQSVLEVKRELFGLDMVMYVVSVLKDKKESDELMDIMVRDKRLAKELETLDYRMFTISSSNYKILKYSEAMDEYLLFYFEHYFESKEDALKMIGATSRSDMLFKLNKNLNHKLVILYPYKDVKFDYIDLLKSYDPDFEVRTEEFDSIYQAVIVENIGSSKSAMRYFSGAKKYFVNKKVDLSKSMMVVITANNYRLMYENKYHDEYLDFFKTHYKHEIDEGKKIDEYGFSYKEATPHKYVLVYSNKVKEKKLLSAFKKYNSKNFLLESFVFDKERNILVVNNLANKKKGMIYYRAVRSNKELYKALKKTSYIEFVISKKNYDVLLNSDKLEKYKGLFKKWYLN